MAFNILTVVVLPAPLGPKSPYVLPYGIFKFRLFTATMFPNFLVKSFVIIAKLSEIFIHFFLMK
ncbi:MAG: hypothetical protein ACFFDY_09875 [Candidatus Thorarchaeota archaeon]